MHDGAAVDLGDLRCSGDQGPQLGTYGGNIGYFLSAFQVAYLVVVWSINEMIRTRGSEGVGRYRQLVGVGFDLLSEFLGVLPAHFQVFGHVVLINEAKCPRFGD